MKLDRVFSLTAFAFSSALIILSLTFAYVMLAPIDVVKDWVITVDDGEYKPGDPLTIHAKYKKVTAATGEAKYYMECSGSADRLTRYEMSTSAANRARGEGDVDIPMRIPLSGPTLPAKCRVVIAVDYNVYEFRIVPETNATNWFTVVE